MKKLLCVFILCICIIIIPQVEAFTQGDCDQEINESILLNQSIIGCSGDFILNIVSDDVVLDCGGFMLEGDANNTIQLNASDITIKNCIVNYTGIENRISGIYGLRGSYTIIDNQFLNNVGINIDTVSDAIIDNNYFNNENNLFNIAIVINNLNNTQISNNLINKGNGIAIAMGSGTLVNHNNLISNNTLNNVTNGVYLGNVVNTFFENNTIISTNIAIWFFESNYNFIYNNNLFSDGPMFSFNSAYDNMIYNNLFSAKQYIREGSSGYNVSWNTSVQDGDRVYSPGTKISGNYWTNSTNDGFSDICDDLDFDTFCDNIYNISDGNDSFDNLDYMSLTYSPIYTSNIVSDLTYDSANILLTINQYANYSLQYGDTSALGTFIDNNNLLASHNISLTNLVSNTLYYYNITSCNSFNPCITDGPYNFTTSVKVEDPVTTSSSGGGSSSGGCNIYWQCSEWSSCVEGVETRVCNIVTACGSYADEPITERTCEVVEHIKEEDVFNEKIVQRGYEDVIGEEDMQESNLLTGAVIMNSLNYKQNPQSILIIIIVCFTLGMIAYKRKRFV
jgi:hypothetical protein